MRSRSHRYPTRRLLVALGMLAATVAPVSGASDPDQEVNGLLDRLSEALRAVSTPQSPPPPEQPPAAEAAEEREPVESVAEPPPAAANPDDIHVSPQGRVEMHVRDVDLGSVLQILSLQSQRNIVATKGVSGRVTANLYNVTFEEALTAILDGCNCGWREQGNFIYVYTREQLREMEKEQQAAQRKKVSRLFRLKYVRAADVQTMVQPLLSPDGKITVTTPTDTGVATGNGQAGSNSPAGDDCIFIVDYADRIEDVARLITEFDVRPRQVLIEATLLRAQLNEDNALGIDFNLVGGVDFRNLDSTSNAMTDINTGQLPQNRLDDTNWTANTDFRGAVPDGGFTFGIIKDNVAAFIRALEQVTDTTVLANPKILALNKQHGEMIVGRRDGYLTTTVTQTAAVQSVEFLETGTQLVFRPFIGDDGYVRMEVHPKDSTGGLTAANLPFEQTTEVTTNIIVRDGHTILIGGLFREVTSSTRGQVPIVGNIPVAGALFRTTRDNTQREEVIILLTVHIVKDEELHAQEGQRLADDVERYRVGMRKGVQWFGRERLAQAHYHWATEHLARGDTSRALWDLDLAINNNPKFMAAIKLKEELLQKRTWDDDASTIRTFLAEQIMKEQQGGVTPSYGRPGPPFQLPMLETPGIFEEDCTAPGATSQPAAVGAIIIEKGGS